MEQHKFLSGALAILLFGACGHAQAVEPASGSILTAEYGVTKDGEAVGQKRYERITFLGHNVRTETLIGDELVMVTVGGDYSWSASPSAGRLLFANVPRKADEETVLLPYPALIRRNFARFFAPHPMVGKETLKGFATRKFGWHEDAVILGDVGGDAQDVQYWVYDDEDFPYPLAYQSSTGGKHEIVEFRLNEAVAPELFAPPKDLPLAQLFHLPKTRFLIELQETRTSTQYGWKVHSTEIFTGDGDKVTRTYVSSTEQNGKSTPFAPPSEIITYEQAEGAIGNRLGAPIWMSVKKTGRETLLKLPCDVLENIVEGLPKEKSWVADHPLLGTIRLRCLTESPGDISDRGVTRLEIQ